MGINENAVERASAVVARATMSENYFPSASVGGGMAGAITVLASAVFPHSSSQHFAVIQYRAKSFNRVGPGGRNHSAACITSFAGSGSRKCGPAEN